MRRQFCDICDREIKTEKILCLEISRWELDDNGAKDSGDTLLEKDICSRCYTAINSFLEKREAVERKRK